MPGRSWTIGDPFEGLTLFDAATATPRQSQDAIERRTARRILEQAIGLGPSGRAGELRAAASWIEPGLASSPVARESTFKSTVLEAVGQGRLLLLRREPITLPASMRIPPIKAEALASTPQEPTDWIEVLANYDDKTPHSGRYRLELPNGRVQEGRLNLAGFLRLDGIPPGTCTFTLLPDEVTAQASAGAKKVEGKSVDKDEAEALEDEVDEPSADEEAPAELPETKPIYLRIHMDPDKVAALQEKFRLFSSDGSYSLTEATDRTTIEELEALFSRQH